jgi:hypothetical protein
MTEIGLSYTRTTGWTDEEQDALARAELGKLKQRVRAGVNRAVLWFFPYRKDGVIETPWDFTPNSVEAVIVDDNTGMGLPNGMRVMAHPEAGRIHEVDGVRLCFDIRAEDILLAVEA